MKLLVLLVVAGICGVQSSRNLCGDHPSDLHPCPAHQHQHRPASLPVVRYPAHGGFPPAAADRLRASEGLHQHYWSHLLGSVTPEEAAALHRRFQREDAVIEVKRQKQRQIQQEVDAFRLTAGKLMKERREILKLMKSGTAGATGAAASNRDPQLYRAALLHWKRRLATSVVDGSSGSDALKVAGKRLDAFKWHQERQKSVQLEDGRRRLKQESEATGWIDKKLNDVRQSIAVLEGQKATLDADIDAILEARTRPRYGPQIAEPMWHTSDVSAGPLETIVDAVGGAVSEVVHQFASGLGAVTDNIGHWLG